MPSIPEPVRGHLGESPAMVQTLCGSDGRVMASTRTGQRRTPGRGRGFVRRRWCSVPSASYSQLSPHGPAQGVAHASCGLMGYELDLLLARVGPSP